MHVTLSLSKSDRPFVGRACTESRMIGDKKFMIYSGYIKNNGGVGLSTPPFRGTRGYTGEGGVLRGNLYCKHHYPWLSLHLISRKSSVSSFVHIILKCLNFQR